MNDKLKPCPFCGESYVYIRLRTQSDILCGSRPYIYCPDCGLIFLYDYGDTEESVLIKKWNKRTKNI